MRAVLWFKYGTAKLRFLLFSVGKALICDDHISLMMVTSACVKIILSTTPFIHSKM